MLHIEDLSAFVEAADRGTFTAAAEALFISQPSMSRRIGRLEHELGGALFERYNRRSPKLSRLGERVLPCARRLLDDHVNLLETAKRASNADVNAVTIAVYASITEVALPSLLRGLAPDDDVPDITLVERQPGTDVDQAVLTNAAELGLTLVRERHPDLESTRVTDLPIVVVGSTEFWDTDEPIEWDEVRTLPLLLGTTRDDLMYVTPAVRAELNVVHERGTPAVLRAMAREGRGVFLAVAMTSSFGLAARELTVNGKPASGEIHLVWRSDAVLSEPAQHLVAAVQSHAHPDPAPVTPASRNASRGPARRQT